MHAHIHPVNVSVADVCYCVITSCKVIRVVSHITSINET